MTIVLDKYIRNMNNIEFVVGKYGTKAIIKNQWQEAFLEQLLSKGVVEIELNDGKGWSGDNVGFIKSFPNLEALTIIDLSIKSIDSIHCLKELKYLTLITYCENSIDFHCFPKLVECSFEWIKGSSSIFELPNIQKLFINRYNEKSSENFSRLVKLEELSILNSTIENLKGISFLTHLKFLRIGNLRKLTSLQGLENLLELEVLKIQGCKRIFTVYEVFSLTGLRNLQFLDLGEIESIKGIENLSKLEGFWFYDSTNIVDGDISPILELKKLKKTSFQNRRHYTNKREDFDEL